MTRGGRLLSGKVATWMDGGAVSPAKTAGPSTALRSGRDDKGRAVTLREKWRLGWKEERFPPRRLQIPALRSGRDDKGRRLLSGKVATWMDGVRSGYYAKIADPCA